MNKLDPEFTKKIQNWLDASPSERDIAEGATLLLQISRNRALYNSAILRPQKFASKIEYELRKHLRIRLDNLTLAEVAQLERTVQPSAQEIVDNPPVLSTDDEIPVGKRTAGKRADHDSLPAEIQALWDGNFDVYKQIKLLFEELKSMSHLQPCDRYDKLRMLEAADRKYRENLAKYDSYVLGQATENPVAEVSDADSKAIGAARKTLSKWRAEYAKAKNDIRKAQASAKIQECVDSLVALGANFSPSTLDELIGIGINFNGKA